MLEVAISRARGGAHMQNSSKMEFRWLVLGPACCACLRLKRQTNMNLPAGEFLQNCSDLRGSGAPYSPRPSIPFAAKPILSPSAWMLVADSCDLREGA